MRRYEYMSLIGALFISVFAFGTSVPSRAATEDDVYALTPQASRPLASTFTLTDTSGHDVSLSHYRGRVVLLDFWATWCTGCKVEIPWYVEFQRRYQANGLTSIGAAMDEEGWSVVKPYLADHPIAYPLVVGTSIADAYRVMNMPMTLLIDRHGRVALSHVGIVDKAKWEAGIRQLLDESPR